MPTLNDGVMIILSSPSGAGKTTLVNLLAKLDNFKVAFKTFGSLNAKKDNAILICHALTGDQYIAEKNPITGRDGWWSRMVGPNKPIDTNKFFVIK